MISHVFYCLTFLGDTWVLYLEYYIFHYYIPSAQKYHIKSLRRNGGGTRISTILTCFAIYLPDSTDYCPRRPVLDGSVYVEACRDLKLLFCTKMTNWFFPLLSWWLNYINLVKRGRCVSWRGRYGSCIYYSEHCMQTYIPFILYFSTLIFRFSLQTLDVSHIYIYKPMYLVIKLVDLSFLDSSSSM